MSEVEIPNTWTQTALGQITQVDSGIGFPNEYQGITTGDLPFFKVGDVSNAVLNNNGRLTVGKHYVSLEVANILRGKPLKPGSTVFAKIGEAIRLNRRGYVTTDCLIDNNVMAVKALLDESDRYIHYFLRTVQFTDVLRATTVPSLRKGDVEGLQIPLAPLPEQKRIANKLDSVLARVDACRDRLDRLPVLLKRFRQSILAAATSGRLTEDWRRQHSNTSKAMASTNDMLAKLAEEQTAAKSGGRAGKIEPLLTDLPDSINLPIGWAVTGFDALAAPERNALKAGPFGSALKKNMYVQDGYKIYGQEQVISGDEDFGDYFIDKEKFQELSSCAVKPGDILISLVGTIGRILILSNQAMPGIINPRLVKLSLHSSISRQYIALYLGSPTAQNFFAKQSHGGTMDILNLGILRELPILLPPPTEQTEIVRRVEILFAFADRLEARLATARRQVGQLTPALLAKAFRGELVAQDPADEPAAELLKRLAAQRETAPKAKRGRASKA